MYFIYILWGGFFSFVSLGFFFYKHVFRLGRAELFLLNCSSSKAVIVCILGGHLVALQEGVQVALEEGAGSVQF